MKPLIRAARPADVAALLELERQFPSDRLSPRALRRLLAAPSAHIWVVPAAGGLDAALVLLTRRGSRVARIYSLVVGPAARGRGLAKALVRRAESAARRAGCRQMALEVRAGNRAARALYQGLGYAEAESLPGYYEDGAAGLRLRRPLSARQRID